MSKPKRKSRPKKSKDKPPGSFDLVLATRARRAREAPTDQREPVYEPSATETAVLDAADDLLDANPDLEAAFLAFSTMRRLARDFAPATEAADVGAAAVITHLLTRFLVGRGNPGDSERLRRMQAIILDSEESRRAHVVQFIKGAMAPAGWPRPAELTWALSLIDPAFRTIDSTAAESLVREPGRKGAAAIAAELSIRCNAFGDIGAAKAVVARFDQAWRALTKQQVSN